MGIHRNCVCKIIKRIERRQQSPLSKDSEEALANSNQPLVHHNNRLEESLVSSSHK